MPKEFLTDVDLKAGLLFDGVAVTAAGKALLDDADAAAQRTTLGAAAVDQTTYVGTTAIALNRASAAQVLTGIQGITFPTTHVDSADLNTLDDYEEGSWTPIIQGTTVAGTGTYTNQSGSYLRVGKITFLTGIVTWTAHTGTGNLRLGGLPYVAASDGVGQISYRNLTVSGTPLFEIIDSQSYANVMNRPTTGGNAAALAMDTSATIYFTICYRA